MPQPLEIEKGEPQRLYGYRIDQSAEKFDRAVVLSIWNNSLPRPAKIDHDNRAKKRTTLLASAREALQAAPRGKPTGAAILGAKDLQTVPVDILLRPGQFDQMTLVDLDDAAVVSAVEKLPAGLQRKIDVVKADITGVTGDIVQQLTDAHTSASTLEDFTKAAALILRKINVKGMSPDLGTDYTFVSSQFLISQLPTVMWAHLNHYLTLLMQRSPEVNKKTVQLLDTKAQAFDQAVYKEHIRYLRRLVASDGRIHFSDTHATLDDPNILGIQTHSVLLDGADINQVLFSLFTASPGAATKWRWKYNDDLTYEAFANTLIPKAPTTQRRPQPLSLSDGLFRER